MAIMMVFEQTNSYQTVLPLMLVCVISHFTVRLLKTSPVNATLDAMYNFQRSSAANTGQNTLRVTDVQRGDVLNGAQMAFVKRPDLTWAKDGGMNEWVFRGIVIETLGVGIPNVNI